MMKLSRDANGTVSFGKGEIGLVGLILASAIAFSLETLPSLSDGQRKALSFFEAFSVGVFTVEYLVRLLGSNPRRRYALGFYGIIDLLAILPFFFSIGVDLRALRTFRFLRIFRLFKLAKYVRGMERIRKSFVLIREELLLFFSASGIVIYLLAMGIYYFERDAQPDRFRSVFDGIWWAVCTLTTVGYGDVYPVTVAGRLFTVVILLTGLGVVAVPAGLFASALSKVRDEEPRQIGPH